MTRRERLERKLERRQEWAKKAQERSASRFASADRIASAIPFGQPILVGHHSERHARADVARIDGNMRKGCEEADLAKHHTSAAGGIAAQLDGSIFSDDENAIEALEARITENEDKRDRMKLVNKLYKSKDVAGLAAIGIDYATLQAKLDAAGQYWGSAPHLPYELTNIGARIRADKERIAIIRGRHERTTQAEAAGGVLIEARTEWHGYCRVTFAEKPEREILIALRAAGFVWGNGHWSGKVDALPACVQVTR